MIEKMNYSLIAIMVSAEKKLGTGMTTVSPREKNIQTRSIRQIELSNLVFKK